MVRKNLAEILQNHVTLELEGIDRMYLNGYVLSLQTGARFAYFVRERLGYPIASTALIAPMSRALVAGIEQFVAEQGLDLVAFRKGERKDDVAQAYWRAFEGEEGVLFVGKAQEKASVFRTEKRRNEAGASLSINLIYCIGNIRCGNQISITWNIIPKRTPMPLVTQTL